MTRTKTFTEIVLRRKNKIDCYALCDSTNQNMNRAIVMMKNINTLGYTFSKSLLQYISNITVEEQNALYLELISCLKEYRGADKVWMPFYPNFPKQVEEAEDNELFVNAIVHYLSGGTLVPDYEKDERLPLFDSPELTVLDYAEDTEATELLNNLVSSKTSLSQTDKEDMIWLLQKYGTKKLPEVIPFKENVAIIASLIMDNTHQTEWKILRTYLKTATDVLRFVTFLSDGDVSLAEKTKYISLPRKKRELILDLLEHCGSSLEEDMLRHKIKWIRLGERLHPREYEKQYPKTAEAFRKLREHEHIDTFKGKLLEYKKDSKKIKWLINALKTRPGEFARMLDFLIRDPNINCEDILNGFECVASQVSIPVLLQVREFFLYRNTPKAYRTFFPKGSLANVYSIQNNILDVNHTACTKIINICKDAIVKQLQNRENLGKVYISPSIKGFCVPQTQRTASKALKPVTRGSRLPIGKNTKCCRGFIWWTNMNDVESPGWGAFFGRVDIDLSAAILDENFNYLSHVSYTNLRTAKFNGYHSGDIVNAGPVDGIGACEFIDVDIDSVVKNGGRYIIYQVYSFTGQKFFDMPHAMFGWMEREDTNSGEIFEASTVEQRIDLTAQSTTAVPVIFDCMTKEYIWLDVAATINSLNRAGANLERNLKGISAVCNGIVHSHKPQMYDLALLHAKAHGTLVDDRNDADIIFDIDVTKPVIQLKKITEIRNENDEVIETKIEFEEKEKECKIITPYDIDYWMSEML